jgi:hypothetical protein
MKGTSVILLCALTMMISLSGGQAVNAGIPSLGTL